MFMMFFLVFVGFSDYFFIFICLVVFEEFLDLLVSFV